MNNHVLRRWLGYRVAGATAESLSNLAFKSHHDQPGANLPFSHIGQPPNLAAVFWTVRTFCRRLPPVEQTTFHTLVENSRTFVWDRSYVISEQWWRHRREATATSSSTSNGYVHDRRRWRRRRAMATTSTASSMNNDHVINGDGYNYFQADL